MRPSEWPSKRRTSPTGSAAAAGAGAGAAGRFAAGAAWALPVGTTQSRTAPDSSPVAIVQPSGEKATAENNLEFVLALWMSRRAKGATFQYSIEPLFVGAQERAVGGEGDHAMPRRARADI